VAAPPLESPCDGPVTYPGDTKILINSSKGRSGPTWNVRGTAEKTEELRTKLLKRKIDIAITTQHNII